MGSYSRYRKPRLIASVVAAAASIVVFAALGGAGLAQTGVSLAQEQHGDKVVVCHKDRTTISISVNAWPAHEAHGDTQSPCTTEQVTTKGKKEEKEQQEAELSSSEPTKVEKAKKAKKAEKAKHATTTTSDETGSSKTTKPEKAEKRSERIQHSMSSAPAEKNTHGKPTKSRGSGKPATAGPGSPPHGHGNGKK